MKKASDDTSEAVADFADCSNFLESVSHSAYSSEMLVSYVKEQEQRDAPHTLLRLTWTAGLTLDLTL